MRFNGHGPLSGHPILRERADAMIMHEIAEVASMNGMVLSGEG